MSLIETIAQDDSIWASIQEHLPGDRKRGSRGFDININCPLCVLRGEARPDRGYRCGLKRNPDGFGINCFNCKLRIRWSYGSTLSAVLKEFMVQLGVPEMDVKRLAHRAHVIRRAVESSPIAHTLTGTAFNPDFATVAMPSGAKPITQWVTEGCDDPRLLDCITYLYGRGDDIAEDREYWWTPEAGATNPKTGATANLDRRILIPMEFHNRIVGWTGRATDVAVRDGVRPRYYSEVPENFLFNNRALMNHRRRFVFIVEGPFDAIAIDGVGTLGAKLSDQQAAWINGSGLTPILVADRDRSGQHSIDLALKHKWHVAFPRLASFGWWDSDVKDAAKAVELYGRLYVARSILETATSDKYKIGTWRKLLV